MAEFKRTFSEAKMNKDSDERVVKSGQYRDANNVEINTSEGSNVSAVQSLLGNTEKTAYDDSAAITAKNAGTSHHTTASPAYCVGSITDEKNDKIYSLIADGVWFVEGTSTSSNDYIAVKSDYILEYDVKNEAAATIPYKFVFNDIYEVQTQTNSSSDNVNKDYLHIKANTCIRDGMIAEFATADSVVHNIKVRHLFTDDSSSTTYDTGTSGVQVFLDKAFTGTVSDNTTVIFRSEKRVLNFDRYTTITGINIIDDFLFWTDNKTEPKRLNIKRSLKGTGGSTHLPSTLTSDNLGSNRKFHTRLYAELDPATLNLAANQTPHECVTNYNNTKPIWVEEEHITTIKKAPTTPPTLEMLRTESERTNPVDGTANLTRSGANMAMTSIKQDETIATVVDPEEIVTVTLTQNVDWRDGDIVLATAKDPEDQDNFENFELRFSVQGSADIASPAGAVTDPAVLQNTFDLKVLSVAFDTTSNTTNWRFRLEQAKPLFEFKFPRFAYRYKYTDGEYSPISPWSEIAFLPFTYDYTPKEGYNLGMVNSLRSLKIKDYLVDIDYRPRDIVEVDILYKEETSPNIYTVKTINRQDGGAGGEDALIWPDVSDASYKEKRGELKIESELIHAAVPSNQLIRPWDNVPRRALGQEMIGNRIVYSNYLQNYNVENSGGLSMKPSFEVGFKHSPCEVEAEFVVAASVLNLNVNLTIPTPKFSVKSLRTYQVGIVFGDEYGRETPVLTDKKAGSIQLEKQFSDVQNMLSVRLTSDPPFWAEYYKYFIKETSSEYYNLAVDRWYNADDGNVWLSFPSSERNKVDIDTFLILKKQAGSSAAIKSKARYKILAIENEAPDFIKINHLELGIMASSNFLEDGYPLKNQTFVYLDADGMHGVYGQNSTTELSDLVEPVTENEVFFRVKTSTTTSDWYRVVKMSLIKPNEEEESEWYYHIVLDDPLGDDVDFTSTANSYATAVSHSVEFKREVIENKPEFDGRFFIKVFRDATLENDVMGITDTDNFSISHTRKIYHSKNLIDFNRQIDEKGLVAAGNFNPPDKFIYWGLGGLNSNKPVDTASDADPRGQSNSGSWYDDDTGVYGYSGGVNNLANAGKGRYIATPYDPTQGDGANTYDVSGSLGGGGGAFNYNTDFNQRDNDIRQDTRQYFKTRLFRWAIDNEMAAYGGAGRGVHADHQGGCNKNEGLDKEGWNEINDCSRVLQLDASGYSPPGQNFSTKNKANSTSERTTSDSPIATTNITRLVNPTVPPPDLYWGPTGNIDTAHNVMHLSKFGIQGPMGGLSGKDTEPDGALGIKGNPNEQEDWEFAEALSSVGTLFRWAEDPDQQVYEIIRVEEQTGIRNWNANDDNSEYWENANRRVRYTIKFQPLGDNSGQGFGTNTPYRFHPVINAVDKNGQAVVIQNKQAHDRPYNFAGLSHGMKNYLTLQIVNPVTEDTLPQNPDPAVFETEPKESVDLDIYYEVSPAYPLYLTEKTNEMLLPIGSYFLASNKAKTKYTITKWNTGQQFTISPAANHEWDTGDVIDIYTTYGGVVQVTLNGDITKPDTTVTIHGEPGGTINQWAMTTFIPWFNCVAFGNGVESDRIRDDYNAPTIRNGVKASTTLAGQYREEHRKNSLIFSGIYNSMSGVNNLNQFIAGENITKDLNPDYGSIQKLHARDTDLIVLCEDRVVNIKANKDAIYKADGDPTLIASDKVLGQTTPISGEYGISKNPESFASYANNAYFTDTSRGSVMHLQAQKLTPISGAGMVDYFADNLKDVTLYRILGTYDEKKSEYNVTIEDRYFLNADGSKRIHEKGDSYYTTVSWNQKAEGWTSFKTFYPEQGVSINNSYFTWKNGSMWEHHSNSARNTFYGSHAATDRSSITTIFNDSPSEVKSFNLMNYEGSQAKITQFTTASIDGVAYNDGEYYNLDAKEGWYCESITTDLQEGEVLEFKNKEGKWYNAIHGVTTTLSNLDNSEFSVQGLGKASVVSHDGTAATCRVTIQDKASDPLLNATVASSYADVTAGATLSNTINITITPDSDYVAAYNNFTINGVGTSDANVSDSGSALVFTGAAAETVHGNLASITFTQSGDNVNVACVLEDSVSADTTIEIDFDWIAAKQRTVPVAFNVYWNTGTKNPRQRNPVNYSNQTVTLTDVANVTEGSSTALHDHSNIQYQTHTATLTYSEETLVFSKTFTAASGYYYAAKDTYNPINSEIVYGHPDSFDRRFWHTKEFQDYIKRWRFVQTILTRDSNKLITSVKVEGYYTTPHYKDVDAKQIDGSDTTLTLEGLKTRGVFLGVPLKKTTTAISGRIESVNALAQNQPAYADDEEDPSVTNLVETDDIRVIDKNGERLPVLIEGTAGAETTITVEQVTGNSDFIETTEDVTLDSKGRLVHYVDLPKITTDEEYRIYLTQKGSNTLNSNVPTVANKQSVYQYTDVAVTLQAAQTGSTYTIPSATNIVTAPAYANFRTDSEKIIEIDAKTSYHKTLRAREHTGEQLYSFSITMDSASGGTVEKASGVTDDEGYVLDVSTSGAEKPDTGGAEVSVRDLYLLESSGDVVMHGYLSIKNLGNSNVAAKINVDDLLTHS